MKSTTCQLRVGGTELALELRLSWCDLLTVLGNKGGLEGSLGAKDLARAADRSKRQKSTDFVVPFQEAAHVRRGNLK
jgi:hypothetical protein